MVNGFQQLVALFLSMVFAFGAIPAIATEDRSAGDTPSAWAEEEIALALQLGFVPEDYQSDYGANITRLEFANMALSFVAFQYHYDNHDGWSRRIGAFLERIPYVALQPEQRARVTVYPTYYSNTVGFLQQLRAYFVAGNGGSDLAGFLAQPRAYQLNENPPELEPPLFDDLPEFGQNIMWAYALGIADGRGDGIFDPEGAITRQEAAAMLWRVYRIFGGDAALTDVAAEAYSDSELIAPWAAEQAALLREWGVMSGIGAGRFDPLGYYTREQSIATFLRLYQHAPVSRAAGNVPPLVPAETDVALMLDTMQIVTVFYRADTDLAIVVFAQPSYTRPVLPDALYVYHRTGGFTKVEIPYSQYAKDFALSEDETKLYFVTHDFGPTPTEPIQFELDLRTAILTEIGRTADPDN